MVAIIWNIELLEKENNNEQNEYKNPNQYRMGNKEILDHANFLIVNLKKDEINKNANHKKIGKSLFDSNNDLNFRNEEEVHEGIEKNDTE